MSHRQMGGLGIMVGRFLAIQHRLNPLHMYCRCLDKGLSKRFSVYLCKSYEILIFIWVTRIFRLIVRFLCIVNKGFSVREEIKRR
jgi:hypothetical protein